MTGATLFSELVRAHYRSEAEEERGGGDGGKARADFEAKLTEFEQKVGQIDRVYWSSRRPSAVALTIGEPHGFRNPFRDTETEARLHRVTDWVTGDRACAGQARFMSCEGGQTVSKHVLVLLIGLRP
jgi:hypothetical protein